MNNGGNLKREEIIASIVTACTAGIVNIGTWYSEQAEASNNEFTSAGKDEIDRTSEASPTLCNRPNHVTQHASHPFSWANGIVEIMSTMGAELERIAWVLEQSNNSVSIDELYEKVMNSEGFEEGFLIEAFEYIYSDDKKARTFLSLNERQQKIWLMKNISKINGQNT